jgi:hypothetical protein
MGNMRHLRVSSKLNPLEALLNKVVASSIKKGDTVICISDTPYSLDDTADIHLTKDKKYEVLEVGGSGKGNVVIRVRDDAGNAFGYFAIRFRKVDFNV